MDLAFTRPERLVDNRVPGSRTSVQSSCEAAGGTYYGDGVDCDPTPCPPAGEEACCFPAGSCQIQTSSVCIFLGGTYQGHDTVCEPNPCPQPTGACCADDGSCTVTTQTECAGNAAHLTSPIGVQSVNVGLREGHDLAARIANAVRNGDEESLADYEVQRRAEWRVLLGLSGPLEGLPGVDSWVEEHRARILPCLPACGPDLDVLLKQIKLERRSEPGEAPGW